jgi:hypothetical protein
MTVLSQGNDQYRFVTRLSRAMETSRWRYARPGFCSAGAEQHE